MPVSQKIQERSRCVGVAVPNILQQVQCERWDFKPLIESLQRRGVRVSVVSTIRSQPPMIADELRRQCDNFIELDELRDVIGRPPREPREAPERAMVDEEQ